MRAVQITETGGPEVMKVVEVPTPEPGDGEIRVAVAAAGLNYLDTYFRSGTYPASLPTVIGHECAGTVTAVGPGVDGFAIGDRIVTATGRGTYAEECLVPTAAAFPLADDVDLEVAAAAALQGLTAHYLAYSVFELAPGHRCLVHAGAGGVGGLLIQMAKRLGAEVFTTVGSEAKAELARASGADHVINYRETDFVEAVKALLPADCAGLDVVYDGVGKDTFDGGLTLLRPRGMMALFGGSSGQVAPFDLQRLNTGGSLMVTRPSLFHFMGPDEGPKRMADLFGWIASGDLQVAIGGRYSIDDAADAHGALEGRQTTGKILILPSS